MGYKHGKAVPIKLPIQLIRLKQTYGKLIVDCGIKGSTLFCTILLSPSSESEIYKILIKYKLSDYAPKSWLIEPQVQMDGNKRPKHIYGFDSMGHPQLCVYDPSASEWSRQQLLATSYVPWIITWLNTYEYWLITGLWLYPEAQHGIKKV